ncbi:uncharacterized protein ARMOST_03621 [Armillaria ostoyae]|uniref:EF-hand domain-containing protein n=2 Tax=Armillaria TaxID=47424 RepID=A0A284QV40_ARMOS|nr:hypothetical protein ARMSODRAFT_946924 [Armillaria solidipes]SJL00309.1 uncharacterized protein ARMOST_03621 [Armillaria ostoyae]
MPAKLLDEEGDITPEFEAALRVIFNKYASPSSNTLSRAQIQQYFLDTNGVASPDSQIDEIMEFMDVDENTGDLSFGGFMQIYQLQTENDEAETWKDLEKHGYDRDLKKN